MTNEVCSNPPSDYTVPVPPDDWRLSKWRGINDIEDWIAYVNENPQLPKYADFRRNKMLPFLRRELQVADRAESREFVDYGLETIAHGEMRSSFSVNRPNQGLTQEAKRLESLGDTQPLVRLFAAMDTARRNGKVAGNARFCRRYRAITATPRQAAATTSRRARFRQRRTSSSNGAPG